MALRIRRARRTDHATLARLAGWPGVEDSPRRTVRLFRNVVSDLAYDIYVGEEDGDIVGLVAVSFVRVLALGGQRATLEDIVVRPDHRGRSIDRALLGFVLRRARKRGVRSFVAMARDADEANLLRELGFHAMGDVYGHPLDEA